MVNDTVKIQVDYEGVPSAMGRIQLGAETAGLHGSVMFAEFHRRSSDSGLVMSDCEIGEACWAPMMAKLLPLTQSALQDCTPDDVTFAHRALSFLIHVAFQEAQARELFLFDLTHEGKVAVTRRPPRLLGRNCHVFGNYREAMSAPAAAFGQVG
jgi:hypothetical protein